MLKRSVINAGDIRTYGCVQPLEGTEFEINQPATHKAVVNAITGLKIGSAIQVDGDTYRVVKAWDEAGEMAARYKGEIDKVDLHSYHMNRIGKFTNLLLIRKN